MKVLLDENLPHELRTWIAGHECFTVAYMKWSGLSNGKLLAAAASAGFEVLLTLDKGFEFQHDLSRLPVAVIVMQAASNDMDDLGPIVPAVLVALATIQPRAFVKVG